MCPYKKNHILLQIGGSIAAFKAVALASKLVAADFEVRSLLSPGGRRFIGEASLEGLTGHPVPADIFEPGAALDHIRLAEWADLILLYPASANRITRLRAGLADDLIGAVFLANNFRAPCWIAPAMNLNMLRHPAVSEALDILRSWGCRILPTGKGRQACGGEGEGRLCEPETVLEMIREHFA